MTRKNHLYTIAINTKAAASSFEHFQIATCMISEGNRIAAAVHLKAALRAFDRAKKLTPGDIDLRADIQSLLGAVERNTQAA